MECIIYKTVARAGVADSYIRKVVFLTLKKIKKNGDISVHLIGDKKMIRLNKIYRGKDKVTDVLSFASQEGSFVGDSNELGDIFICIPQIHRQAKENTVSFREEITRMLIHGVMHLAGYDHVSRTDADTMFGIQESLLKKIII